MRRLVYIPIIHTELEMGSVSSSLKEEYIVKFGKEKWQEHIRVINGMWEWIKGKIKGLKLTYEKVRVYQDGLPLCGKELDIVQKLAKRESINYKIILELIKKGAKLEGTESQKLLLEEYNYIKNISAPSIKKRYEQRSQQLLIRRDRYIANRINKTLNEDETGILFIGAEHEVDKYLASDIKVDYLIYRPGE
ncbi:MAG: hypothetical protein U9O41_03595 [Candidatus Aerophobetes bacterium]|nr:hypothetical protein [Candidatus Aerophobetes bacterium]